LTTREGLPHNSVNDLAQTPDGHLWLATWEGVARYNGREFRVFGRETVPELDDVAMRTLHIDEAGVLWVGGVRGDVLRYDRGEWTRLDSVGGFVNALLHDRQGRLWVGQESLGLMRIDPDGQRTIYGRQQGLAGDSVFALAQDADGEIWVGTSGGLGRVMGDRVVSQLLKEGTREPAVLGVSLDRSGRLLLAADRGAFRARSLRGEDGFDLVHPELAREIVYRILEDAAGTLWIGLSINGLARLQGGQLERFSTDEGLPSARVLSILLDAEGALWTATNGGLMRMGPAAFSNLSTAQGLSDNFVRAVLPVSNGDVWVGTGRGLNLWRQGALRPKSQDDPLARLSVLSLAEDSRGDLLVGTFDRGVLRVRDGAIIDQIDSSRGLPANQVRSLLSDSRGRLWIGTIGGLARLAPGDKAAQALPPGPAGAFVIALSEDAKGSLWIGTPQGLDRLRPEAGAVIEAGAELPGGARSLFAVRPDEAGTALWLSSDRGLLHLQIDTGKVGLIGPAQGLPIEKVFFAQDDGAGHLWLSSNRGAIRIRRDEARAVLRGQMARLQADVFDEAHGMASAQCNTGFPASALGPEGALWIATSAGIATIPAERLGVQSTQTLPTSLEDVTAEGQALPLDRAAELPAGTARIEFSVAGLGFVMPERVHYRYRLEGFDSDWVERGRLHVVEYTNLAAGAYRLRAQAAYMGSPWTSEEASFEFVILPHLWERTWVQIALLLCASAAVALLYRLRVSALRRRAVGLERAVARKTAELRQTAEQLLSADAEKSQLLVQLRQQAEAFERQAREDALTGLANRRAFDEITAREFLRARRTRTPLCLALLDIDHFKRVNDSFSHSAGDTVICRVARLMEQQCREMDVLCRWGGEEFALLLPHTGIDDAERVCERLRLAFAEQNFDELASGLNITVSIGLCADTGLADHHALLSHADSALYVAKRGGRNRVVRGPTR
jgi:diguanylate cyclase (GGDEF)-like protein